MAGYEAGRNAVAMPIYQLTLQQVSYEPPPPELQRLIARVASRPEEASRFLGLLSGATSIAEYFAPENLQRLMAPAAPSALGTHASK